MLPWDFQYGLNFLSQMHWTDVWIPLTINPHMALVQDCACGEDIRTAELIRVETVGGEYIEKDAHKLHGQLSFHPTTSHLLS